MKIKMYNENEKPTQLVERKEIEGTPFTAVKMENEQWCLTLGRYILTPGLKNYNDVVKQTKSLNWELLLKVMNIVSEFNQKNN